MRLFVAAELVPDVHAAIAAVQERIAGELASDRRAARLRWLKPEQMHLTLVFLGDVVDARVPELAAALGRGIDQRPFDVTFESVGVFPARGAPRVLWVGVGAGADEVASLQRELAARLAALGVPLEDRPFRPHLTLARWRESRPPDSERALKAAPRGIVARARIDGATLYQSRLSPAGSTYTPLARATLTGGPEGPPLHGL